MRHKKVRVTLPFHLRNLAHIQGEVIELEVAGPQISTGSILDCLEARYPMLRGTIRDHDSKRRRPFIRFFVNDEDCSNLPADAPLPDSIVKGEQPFRIIGAMAGG